MSVFSGEICTACHRPILVDETSPQIARCRKCGVPYHTQCWFASRERCVHPGCDGKASEIAAPKITEPVGEICPFLPPEPARRDGGEPAPARCLKSRCMVYDAVERRCAVGEIAYALAAVRHSGLETRSTLTQSFGRTSRQLLQLLSSQANSLKNAEGVLKSMREPQVETRKAILHLGELLERLRETTQGVGDKQGAIAAGFESLARAVEASGVGERTRSRREARLAARVALRDGRPGAAVRLLGQAQQQSADEAVAGDLAIAYIYEGKGPEAVEVLEGVLQASPDNTPCRITLAALRLEAGDAPAAESLLRDAPEPLNPLLRAELAYARACVAYAVGRSEDSVTLLNDALDFDPWHAPSAAALADLRARRRGTPVPEAAAVALSARGVAAKAPGDGEG